MRKNGDLCCLEICSIKKKRRLGVGEFILCFNKLRPLGREIFIEKLWSKGLDFFSQKFLWVSKFFLWKKNCQSLWSRSFFYEKKCRSLWSRNLFNGKDQRPGVGEFILHPYSPSIFWSKGLEFFLWVFENFP